jgi:4'-phosphopantetheinyl transferase EntD
MLATLAPMGWPAAVRCAVPDPARSSPYAIEIEAVARAVPSRRAEFLTGRAVARAALGDLGVAPGPIARRSDRAPDWPAGIIGSITHTTGLCAAAVARPRDDSGEPLGIGIDAEVDVVLDEAVVRRVLTVRERDLLGVRAGLDAVVSFSAKEALFKALNPATGVWLEANEVEIALGRDTERGADEADGGPISVLSWTRRVPGLEPADAVGRWARVGSWVVAAIVVRPDVEADRPATGPPLR